MKPINILKIALVAVTLVVGCNTTVDSDTATPSTFVKVFGGAADDAGWGVRQTSDGGYIIVGTTASFGHGKKDVYLIKTDAGGNQQWAKTYGGEEDEEGRDVQQTHDGGYIIVGSTLSFAVGANDMYVIKTNANGDTSDGGWARSFGGTSDDVGNSIEQTSDGGFIAGGTLKSPPAVKSDFWVVKWAANGEKKWDKNPFGGEESCQQVRQASNGNYIAVGTAGPKPAVAMVNAQGQVIFALHSFVSFDGGATAVIATRDGKFVVVGYTTQQGSDALYVFRVDSTAQVQEQVDLENSWGGNYGMAGGSRGFTIHSTRDGGFVALGYSGVSGGGRDFYLVKLDSSAKLQWSNTFGQSGDDEGHSVEQTSDGGYIMVGTSKSFLGGANGNDIMLVKVNAAGQLQ